MEKEKGKAYFLWDTSKIRALRTKLNLTQKQFAEIMGTSQILISYWETGKRNPGSISQKCLTFLAEKKGVKLEQL